MGEKLRLAVGVLGNAASLLLYLAPILTFKRVLKNKSTEEFSCVPYILALLNCLLYTWYGLPVVSVKWENFPLVSINGTGILLECSFIAIYLWFASATNKKLASLLMAVVILVFASTAMVSSLAFHDHHHRKVLVGSIGLFASVSMYASPLVAVKQVIETKSVEFMPFYLSFFSFLSSSLWMAYGLLSRDLFLASPNLLGSPLGLLQLALYFMFRRKKGRTTGLEETKPYLDVEKSMAELKMQQIHMVNNGSSK